MPELLPFEPGTPEWLNARRQGVTATDIVTIIGLSHYDSVYSLFWRKMGQVPEVEDNDRFRLGRELEQYVADRWSEDAERGTRPGGLIRHSDRAWQLATLDRRTGALAGDSGWADEPVELKSWADADRRAWDAAPPPAIRAQVLWQMDTMDVSTGHVGVVFLPSGEFRSYTIEHDQDKGCDHGCTLDTHVVAIECEVCTDQMLMRREGEWFMRRLRLELPPPDPDSSLATLAAVRARFARVPAKQAEIDAPTFGRWIDAKQQSDHWDRLMRGYEIELREQAGEAAELCVDGQVVARRIISDATVKEHVRHQDYFRRVKQQGDDDE